MRMLSIMAAGVCGWVCGAGLAWGQETRPQEGRRIAVEVRETGRYFGVLGKEGEDKITVLSVRGLGKNPPDAVDFYKVKQKSLWALFTNLPHDVIDKVVEDKLQDSLQVMEEEAGLAVVSPSLNSGESFTIREIRLGGKDDHEVTVVAEAWRDNRPRKQNLPARWGQLVSLGKLPPAGYTLKLELREMFADQAQEAGEEGGGLRYAWTKTRVGSGAFYVADPKVPSSAVAAPVPVMMGQLKDEEPGAEGKGVLYQEPAYAVWSSKPRARDETMPVLRVGMLDAESWAGGKIDQEPELGAVAKGKGQLLAQIVPLTALDNGEWMSVKEIAWRGTEVTIGVEVWKKDVLRRATEQLEPQVIVPLAAGKVGKYKVDVNWAEWHASGTGLPFRVGEANDTAKLRGMTAPVGFEIK